MKNRRIAAFQPHLFIPRQDKDEIVRKLMKSAPEPLRLHAQRAVKRAHVRDLGKLGMLELWFRLGVALNEVEEGR
jgi:hypothetical protein